MKTFLMCPPTYYACSYVINPWMEPNVNNVDRARAIDQWNALVAAVEQHANVELVEPSPDQPDMVFTANAGSFLKPNLLTLSNFSNSERQGERKLFRSYFEQKGQSIAGIPREHAFEGDGDVLHDHAHNITWMGWGFRTMYTAIEFIGAQSLCEFPIAPLQLVDPRFYHLDTCFSPLPNGELMYFPPALSEQSRDLIELIFQDLPDTKYIHVSEEDATNFACNAIHATDNTLITPLISDHLLTKLQDAEYNVIQLDLSEFIKTGGAAKCLALEMLK